MDNEIIFGRWEGICLLITMIATKLYWIFLEDDREWWLLDGFFPCIYLLWH